MDKGRDFFSEHGITESKRKLYTPSETAKNFLLYVQEAGTLKSLKQHKCMRSEIASFLLMVVTYGKGTITIKGDTYLLRTGDCVLVDCMEPYEHMSSSDDAWELAWIHFNGFMARTFYELFLDSNKGYVTHLERMEVIIGAVERILDGDLENKRNSELFNNLEIVSLLTNIIVKTDKQHNDKIAFKLSRVREYINENYATKSIMNDIECEFEESIQSLNEAFADKFGIGINEYLLNRRYNVAKELLRFTIKPLEQIVEESGLGSKEEMQQLFVDKEDSTAEDYRRKWAQWIK